MRPSIAQLADTTIRLADLAFPCGRVHVHRTRLAFIHLDNLLHFAKHDRDGRIDGYAAAYLPDELIVLLFRGGDVATAVRFGEKGRGVVPIGNALKRIRAEPERGELAFCDAPLRQLAWMYESCAGPAAPRALPVQAPALVAEQLREETYSGVLEVIVDGRVSYLLFQNGRSMDGYFQGGKVDPGASLSARFDGLFAAAPDGTPPRVAAALFRPRDEVPSQAPDALLQIYRELFWAILAAAAVEVPDTAAKRALRLRDALSGIHKPLTAIGTPLDQEVVALVGTPGELTHALADWALQLLEELEILAPGIAPRVLRDATREHRFVLQKTDFYGKLPWTVTW
jgi:hypothetical protein